MASRFKRSISNFLNFNFFSCFEFQFFSFSSEITKLDSLPRSYQLRSVCSIMKNIIFLFEFSASRLRHNGPLHFCTTPPCLEAAADILGSLNSSFDPCTDFWSYSCRGWLTRQPIPATRSRWSTIEEMDFQLRVDKSRIIAMSSHEPSQFNSNEWKVDNFYQVSHNKKNLQ